MSRPRRVDMRGVLILLMLTVIGTVLVLIVGVLYIFNHKEEVLSVVIATNPVQIVYFPDNTSTVVVTLPIDRYINGAHAVGNYSLESLWRLGVLDFRDEHLLRLSLEQALGVPIQYYLGIHDTSGILSGSLHSYKEFFSVGQIVSKLQGRFRTNMNFLAYIRVLLRLTTHSSDKIKTYDLSTLPLYTNIILPDETVVNTLDPSKLDVTIPHIFEVEAIRRGSIRLAVYNTTSTPALGSTAGRLLNNIGGNVVEVGNDPQIRETCVLIGTNEHTQSAIGLFIQSYFSCKPENTVDDQRADIILKLGKDYERMFLPRE